MTPIKLVRGDTFAQTCTYTVDDVAVAITGYTITSQVRDQAGALVQALTVAILTQSGATLGQFTIGATYTQTAAWPTGQLVFDIQTTDTSAVRISSEEAVIIVSEGVTA